LSTHCADDQLFAEPVTVTEIVLGKVIGLVAAHILATVLGFSFTGVLVGSKVGTAGMSSYLVLVGFTILVGVVFAGARTIWLLGECRPWPAF